MDILSRCSSISHEFIIKNVPSQNKLDQAEDFDTSYDKNSLIFYDRLKIISSIALFIGHIIFCTGLFYPIIILKDGIYSDHSIFVPHSETLLHSIKTLFEQGAYITLFVALAFSVTLPFIKITLTIYAVYKSASYKNLTLDIIRSINFSELDNANRLNKLCHWILFSLKSICKFQFVDSIIILFNVAFLKNSFIVSSTGKGIVCVIIYCLISIPSTQLLYHSFYEESKILDKWVKRATNLKDTELNLGEENYIFAEISVVFFSMIMIFSSIVVLSHEKLFFVGFTIDSTKKFIIGGSEFSYMEIISTLYNDPIFLFSYFILLVLGIIIPAIQTACFLFGIILYNLHLKITDRSKMKRRFGIGKKLKSLSIKLVRRLLYIAQVLSDWACADVIALALIATRSNLVTAPRVIARVPPSYSISAFYMLISLGLSSFSIQILLNHRFVYKIIDDYDELESDINSSQIPSISQSIIHANTKNMTSTNVSIVENYGFQDKDSRISGISDNMEGRNSMKETLVNYAEARSNINLSIPPVCTNNIQNTSSIGKRIDKFPAIIINSLACILVSISVLYSYKYNVNPIVLNISSIQKFMDDSGSEMFYLMRKNLPASAGVCSIDGVKAPTPCSDIGNIYVTKSVLYFNVPWITGIDTIRLTATSIKSSGDRIKLDFMFRFGKLSIYSIVGSYIFSKIHELYRGYDACCGVNVGMNVKISLKCSNTEPVISDIKIQLIRLSNVHLGKLIEDMVNKFLDVRKFLDSKITSEANKFLDPQNKFIYYQDMNLSVQDLMNYLVKVNAPAGLICRDNTAAPGAQ